MPLKSFTPTQLIPPNRRTLAAAVFSGFVILFFIVTSLGFLSTSRTLWDVVHFNRESELANAVDTNFQLAISKGKNFAFLKNEKNKDLSLGYLQKARTEFAELSEMEKDQAGKDFVSGMGLGLKNVEFPLGIFFSQSKKSDPPEKLYRRYLKDITIDFDNASQAYVEYLNGKIRKSQDSLSRQIHWALVLLLLGALLSLAVMGLSLSITKNLREALRVEEDMLEQEKRFRTVAETAYDAILIFDEQGRVTYANPAVMKIFGFSPVEVVGGPLGALLHEGLGPYFLDILNRHLTEWNQGEAGATFEFVGRHRNGKEIFLDGSFGEFAKDGKRFMTGILRDITSRWEIESDLRESQQRLRMFEGVTQESILLHDQGIIVDGNQALARMLGYEPSELIGQHLSKFMDQDSTEQTKIRLEKGYPDEPYEIRARRKNGTTFPLEIHGSDFDYRGKKMRVSTGWDISYRKRIEQAFIESEERYRRFAEVTKEGIFIHDNGICVDVNQSLLDMFGYTAAELIGKDTLFLLEEASADQVRAMANTGYLDKPYELLCRRKDGSRFPAEFHGRAFTFEGKSRRVVSVWDITDRKKTEDELRKSEENFRNLIQSAPDAILLVRDNKIVYSNKKSQELLGYGSPEELAQKGPLDLVHPDDREFIMKRMAHTQSGGENPSTEIRMLRSDGSILSMESTSVGIQFEGRPSTLVISRDITDRKKAGEALRQSEEKFRSLIENSFDIISITGPDGTVGYISPSVKRVLGYDPSELVGKGFTPIMHPDDIGRMREEFKNLLARKGVPVTVEFRLRHKNGGWREVESTGINLLENPSVRGNIYNIRDITDKKQAEEELKISEEKFRSFIENSFDLFNLVNGDGTIQYISPSVKRILGYDPGELMGKNSLELVHPQDVPEATAKLGQILEQPGSMVTTEMRFRHKDGSWRDLEVTAMNLLENPSVQGIVSNNRDITAKKRAEEALRHSEENFRNMIENSHDVFLLLEKNGVIRYASPSLRTVMGYEPVERLSRHFAEIIHPEDMAQVGEFFDGLSRVAGSTRAYQARALHKDGTWHHIEGMATNLLDHPSVRGIVLNYRDVTEKKMAEKAIRDSEENFRSLIENSSDVISLVGVDGKARYISPSIKKVMGYEPEERLGHSFLEIVHPDDQARVMDLFREFAYKPGVTVNAGARAKHKNGTWRHVEAIATNLIHHPAIQGIIFNYRDVTEKKLAEEGLRQSEENFRNLIEKSPDAMLIHRPDSILYANPAFSRLTGYDQEGELMGKSPAIMLPPEERESVMERVRKLETQGGVNPPVERMVFRRDGTRLPVEVVSFSIQFQGGPATVAVMRDLTEKKNTEQALMKFERLSTIGEMAAGLAHEIRNPLASISTAAQILKRKLAPGGEKNGVYLATILEQSERLEQLVKDTMDYSRGERVLPQEPFPLKPALESALRLCQVQFGPTHSKVKVEWELPKKDLKLLANPQRIQQVLINLILNAYQVMPEGGTMRIGLKEAGDKALIRVEDSGPGIRNEDMNRLFEPFFTTKGGGSGLGLAISQRIAEEHGGKITMERLKPRGTAFIFELPMGGV